MKTERICPSCKKPLPADAPQGLCVQCLMKAGFSTVPNSGTSEGRAFIPPSVPELASLFPQLEILELLGRGGMGAVYKARQPALDRLVALKILPRQPGSDAGFAERFTREARALAKLNHPNIVAVYEFGQAGELHYFVMEFVDGPNLRQLQQAGGISPREALKLIPQICEALQFAHDEGVVHRDIKPENVMVNRHGRVKITDFGLARILGREATDFRLTGAADVMGTPHYMAPEQIEHPQDVDHRADIYSLGVVFYEMLTGELPLGRFAPPSQKVQVDVRLDEVVLHALEKEPERRYQHASEVKAAVDSIATAPPGSAPMPSTPSSAKWNPTTALRRAVAVGGVVFAVISLLAVLITMAMPREYRAHARVKLRNPQDPGAPVSQNLALDAVVRATGDQVLERVASELDLRKRWASQFQVPELSADQTQILLTKRLLVRADPAAVLSIQAWSPNPEEAAEIANKTAQTFCATFSDEATLLARATVPAKPIRPNTPLNLLIGGAVAAAGGLLAAFGAFVLSVLLQRFRRSSSHSPVGPDAQMLLRIKALLFAFASLCFIIGAYLAGTMMTAVLSVIAAMGFAIASASHLARIQRAPGAAPHWLTRSAMAARWVARAFGILFLSLLGVMILGEGLPAFSRQPGGVQLTSAALGIIVLAFIASWRWEGLGAILLGAGWMLWQVSEGELRLGMIQLLLPIALLLGFSWWVLKGRRTHWLILSLLSALAILVLGIRLCPANVRVTGSVIEQGTGEPVRNAELWLVPASGIPVSGAPNARTGKDGRFNLYVGWFSEDAAVSVSAPGHLPIVAELGPKPFGQRRITRDFSMQKPAPVHPQVPAAR